ncbi:MAG: hypothetical protein J6X88_06745 [Bacteroidales bacterium]|nr:hypothetical protein [Bacteroidales bacterium]
MTHSSVSRADSSPNLGEQPKIQPAGANDRASHSSPKLGEVVQRTGGVCRNQELRTKNAKLRTQNAYLLYVYTPQHC